MRKNKRFSELTNSIVAWVSIMISVLSLITAINANDNAQTANEIASESLRTEKAQYTPILSCEYKSNCDSEKMEVTFYNSGGSVQEMEIEVHSFWEIACEDSELESQVLLLPVVGSPMEAKYSINNPDCLVNIVLPYCNTIEILSIIKDYEEVTYIQTGDEWFRPNYLNLVEVNYTDALGRMYKSLYCYDGFGIDEGRFCSQYECLIDACHGWIRSSSQNISQGTQYMGYEALEYEIMNGKHLFKVVCDQIKQNNWVPYISK